jgi:hypothetical protein
MKAGQCKLPFSQAGQRVYAVERMALTLPDNDGCQSISTVPISFKRRGVTMVKFFLNVLALTILVTFSAGSVARAQETAPSIPSPSAPPAATAPAPAEGEKKMEGEKQKGKKGKKGKGKKKDKKNG